MDSSDQRSSDHAIEDSDSPSSVVLGNYALEFIEYLKDRYGEDFELGTVCIIAETVRIDEDEDEISTIEYMCTDERRWAQVGFLTAALKEANRMIGEYEYEDEDD